MRKTKTHFGLMILFFLTLIVGGSVYYNNYNYTKANLSYEISYNQTSHNSCHINVIESTIILRMDDVRAYSKLTQPLVNEILDRNLSATLGVIPRDLEKDRAIINYLLKVRENPNIEIAQHGTHHDDSDKNITEDVLLEGNAKIQKLLGIKPITYIPPHNDISQEAKKIVSNYFRIISGEQGIFKEGENIAEIGYITGTYKYNNNEIINECKFSLDRINVCVVMIHPQEYAEDINNPITLSQTRFEEFKHLLDELQKLNATFKNFHDIVTCSK